MSSLTLNQASNSRIFDVRKLADFLQKASQSCVLVTLGTTGSACTGFFVLPDTIVIPYYALPKSETTHILAISDALGQRIAVLREFLGEGLLPKHASRWGLPDLPLFALLEIEPVGVPLPLAFTTALAGDFVALLQHPFARKTQAISFGELTGSNEGVLTYAAETERGSG
ncbi:MAG TPA: hypothetical protein VF608_05080, partial [Thermoanaerobaculia bacterium]